MSDAPLAVRIAAALATIQGLALTGVAVFLFVKPAFTPASNVGLGVFAAVLALLGGCAFAGLAQALVRLRAWARSPLFVLEFVCLPVGYSLTFQGSPTHPQYGVPVLAFPLAVFSFLATRQGRDAFRPR